MRLTLCALISNALTKACQGRYELKETLASEYSRILKRRVSADRHIAITAGATAAILSCLMAFVEPGDEVIVIEPLFNL